MLDDYTDLSEELTRERAANNWLRTRIADLDDVITRMRDDHSREVMALKAECYDLISEEV